MARARTPPGVRHSLRPSPSYVASRVRRLKTADVLRRSARAATFTSWTKIFDMTRDYSPFRPSRLWKRMASERRAEAAELFWTDEQSAEQQIEAVTAIASHMKFRPKSVLALPLDKKVRYLATLPNVSDSIAARALVNFHLERQRPMMSAFLDALGITHENGLITEENVAVPDGEKLAAAAEELASSHPPEDVALYFSTLVSQDPDTWGGLAELPQTGGEVVTGEREKG